MKTEVIFEEDVKFVYDQVGDKDLIDLYSPISLLASLLLKDSPELKTGETYRLKIERILPENKS